MIGSQPEVAGNALPVYAALNAAAGITPVTGGGLVNSIVAKAAPGVSAGATAAIPSGGAAGWLVGYNAATVPADGAVDPIKVLQAAPFAAGPSMVSLTEPFPIAYSIGVVYYLTSGASPYANKASAGYSAFISAQVQ